MAMSLKLYNTLTRSNDEFVPLEPGRVKLYTCGPTVYAYAHIGNLRTYIFEDVLRRTLAFFGYNVHHVMNVTDVGHLVSDGDTGEDKMELSVRREGKTAFEIAEFYWGVWREDMARLNIIEPTVWCKATDHIPEQIALVQQLEAKGLTYILEDGVYFDSAKFDDYGKMARLDVEGLQEGARIGVVEGKRNLTDFALWKFSPKDKQRHMEWESPWGIGFPGWHIECSAMAMHYLGDRMDIHCGGIDHIAVHHTNEIAQSESVLGHRWVNWWMHGEFLVIGEGEKMAKSTGNFLTLETVAENGHDPVVYRYFCLNGHYRSPLRFTWEALASAGKAFERLRQHVLTLRESANDAEPNEQYMQEFTRAVGDDMNMPRALAAMWGVIRDDGVDPAGTYATLLKMDNVLGLGIATMQPHQENIPEEILVMAEARTQARKNRDFQTADRLRDEISAKGYVLEDNPDGTVVRKK